MSRERLILSRLEEMLARNPDARDDLAALCNGEAVIVRRGEGIKNNHGFTRLGLNESIFLADATFDFETEANLPGIRAVRAR